MEKVAQLPRYNPSQEHRDKGDDNFGMLEGAMRLVGPINLQSDYSFCQ